MIDKTPFFSADAEQALLGAILFDNSVYHTVAEYLRPEHFFDQVHGLIFEACAQEIGAGRLASPVTMDAILRGVETYESAKIQDYLKNLAASVPSLSGVGDYGRVIFDLSLRREIASVGTTMADAVRHLPFDGDARDVLSKAEQTLQELQLSGQRRKAMSIGADSDQWFEDAQTPQSDIPGRRTGLEALDQTIGGLQGNSLFVLAGRPSMGKAQPLDAKVLTPSGWVNIGNLNFGDPLVSPDGKPSRVTGLFPQGQKQIYRVTFSDGRSTECCAEHLWAVESSKFKGRKVIDTKEIARMIGTERYRRRLYVPRINGDFGHAEALPIDPWALGVLIGNGILSSGHCGVSTADAATLFRMQELVAPEIKMRASGDYDYHFSANENADTNWLRKAIAEFGLDCRAERKFIPGTYLNADRVSRIELLRGLMDTDGWVESFGSIRYSTSSETLANDVATLVRSLGGVCSTSTKMPKYQYKGERRIGLKHYVLNIRLDDPRVAFSLERKARRCNREKPVRLTVVSVEPTRVAEAICISVSHPDRLYVTDDYIVTHNTAAALSIARGVCLNGAGVHIASMEMDRKKLWVRMLSDIARMHTPVPYNQIGRRKFFGDEKEALNLAHDIVKAMPIYIDDQSGRSVEQVAASARRSKRLLEARGVPLGLVVVDYLQLMKLDRGYANNPSIAVGLQTKAMKELAEQLDCTVLLLSQLNRAVEQRDDKRPQMADLRQSGEIEQDADIIGFLLRPEYYVSKDEKASDDDIADVRGMLRMFIDKNRQGETTGINFDCDIACNAVRNAGEIYPQSIEYRRAS